MVKKTIRLMIRLLVIHSIIFFVIAVLFGCKPSPKPSETQYELQTFAQNISSDIFNKLKYRHIGPPGNRVSAVYGVPGDPNIYYAGSPAGGIHKTTDGGINWTPIFDDQTVLCIGSPAVARAPV